jgi:hypothetical protein
VLGDDPNILAGRALFHINSSPALAARRNAWEAVSEQILGLSRLC